MLRAVAFDDPGAEQLTRAMEAELTARYGEGGVSPARAGDFATPPAVFLVAELDGRPVACGGLRLLEPGVAEVKRMYVDPSVRGRGLARQLLRELVDGARAAGLAQVRLETGSEQPESVALYVSEGFTPVPAYGHYRDDPRSLCFGLELT